MQTQVPAWLEKVQQPKVLAGIAGLVLMLLVALVWVVWRWGIAEDRFEMMEKKAAEGFLQAPSSTRTVRVDPRTGQLVSVNSSGFPQRIDLFIAARSDRFERFRVSLVRDDGTLVLHADRMVRDSNNDLRLSLNTSILPDGKYLIRVEGYTRGGEMERYAEARMQVMGR
jgi:hypothetical protein